MPEPRLLSARFRLFGSCGCARRRSASVALQARCQQRTKRCQFDVVEGTDIDFDPDDGTMQAGQCRMPILPGKRALLYLHRRQEPAGRSGQQLIGVVIVKTRLRTASVSCRIGRRLRGFRRSAKGYLQPRKRQWRQPMHSDGAIAVLSSDVFQLPLYGLTNGADLFNPRQLLALATFASSCRKPSMHLSNHMTGVLHVRLLHTSAMLHRAVWPTTVRSLCTWHTSEEDCEHTFAGKRYQWSGTMLRSIPLAGSAGKLAGVVLNAVRRVSSQRQCVATVHGVRGIGYDASISTMQCYRLPSLLIRRITMPFPILT